jgi:hypothetical protein
VTLTIQLGMDSGYYSKGIWTVVVSTTAMFKDEQWSCRNSSRRLLLVQSRSRQYPYRLVAESSVALAELLKKRVTLW